MPPVAASDRIRHAMPMLFGWRSSCGSWGSHRSPATAYRSRLAGGSAGPSWLIDSALVVPDNAATEIGHAVGGRAGLDH